MTEVGTLHFLAASDWQTIAAIIVFTLISVVANWVKKRGEANAPQRPPHEADDEFEPVELFEEPRPTHRPTPVAQPTAIPIPKAVPRRAERLGKPVSAREHSTEAQVRISSILRTPKTPLVSSRGGKGPPSQNRAQGAAPQRAEAELTAKKGGEIPDFRDAKTLRQAVIAAELLRPPVALRETSDLPGLSF